MGELRLGIIGAGKTAQWHVRAYRALPGVRIAAIANPHSARGRELARRYAIPEHYAAGDELLARAAIDAVDICVPTALHHHFLVTALTRGLHVAVEKPFCLTAAEAAEIVALNRQFHRVIFNGFNYRFLPEFRRLREMISAGHIGDIRYLRSFRTTMEPPGSGLLTEPKLDLFREFHCHFLDLLGFLGLAEPVELYAAGVRVHDWPIAPDTATLTVRDASGALAELTVSVASPGLAPELFIIGTKGTITLRYGAVSFVPHRREWPLSHLVRQMFSAALTVPWRVLRNPFAASCRHFSECATAGRPSPCDERAAWRVLQLAELAGQSWREQRPLAVPSGSDLP